MGKFYKMIKHIVENKKKITGPKVLPDQMTFYMTRSGSPVNLGNTLAFHPTVPILLLPPRGKFELVQMPSALTNALLESVNEKEWW